MISKFCSRTHVSVEDRYIERLLEIARLICFATMTEGTTQPPTSLWEERAGLESYSTPGTDPYYALISCLSEKIQEKSILSRRYNFFSLCISTDVLRPPPTQPISFPWEDVTQQCLTFGVTLSPSIGNISKPVLYSKFSVRIWYSWDHFLSSASRSWHWGVIIKIITWCWWCSCSNWSTLLLS